MPEKHLKLLKQKKKFDLWILALPIFLALFGLLMIYEASNVAAFRDFADKYYFVKDQIVWLIIGGGMMFVTSQIPYKKYSFLCLPLLFFTLVLLILVFLPGFGIKAQGATRWLAIGSFSFQPSELAKIAIILYLSAWFATLEKKRFLAFLLLLLATVGLVVLQPDLGTAIVLIAIFIMMYFLSGGPFWHFLILVPATLAATFGLAIVSPYRLRRLVAFLNPNFDPLGASYHIRQILIALGSGGIFGLGPGASRQKYQFLPEATTDSIFAIIAEEFGFLGASLLIILFLILFYRIFQVARNAPDRQSFLLAGGILTLLACQVLINLGSMVALFPLTGVPLPFISYGGSNLIVSLASIGIILNISKHSLTRSERI